MTTKLIHPYFGALDTCAVEGVSEDDSYDVLWEQEIPYKDSIIWVSFWFSKGNNLLKERLDAFEAFIKNLPKREEQARKALIQYLKEHPDYFNHFKEKTKKAPCDIETFVSELETASHAVVERKSSPAPEPPAGPGLTYFVTCWTGHTSLSTSSIAARCS